jgi:tRNA(Ile)-lysidine synthase
MKKIVVAVSGGVDSIVLLDILVNLVKAGKLKRELIVAHFEHGIRDVSADDLEFVSKLAKNFGLKFEFECGDLGKNASEDKARAARYEFLRKVSDKYGKAEIATAHHKNDLVETILINFQRGTGWRGLAVLDSDDIWRPLISKTKNDLLNYAKKHKLLWHEDSTNESDKYLRNRLRRQLRNISSDDVDKIYNLWQDQIKNKDEIDNEVLKIIKNISNNHDDKIYYPRYFFAQIESREAVEILRQIVINETSNTLTRPQLFNLWMNIKTISTGKKIDITGKKHVCFAKTEFFFE